MKRSISFVCAALMAPALAVAQPSNASKAADDFYKEGETQYNLGNFSAAVEAFKKGYEAEPEPSKKAAYLFNVAQSYRQAKDCGQSQFFYKRYLALKAEDTVKPLKPEKRAEIEQMIKDLDVCVQQQEALKNRPPDSTKSPDNDVVKPEGKSTTVADASDGDDDDDGGGISKRVEAPAPTLLSLRLTGGASKVLAGDIKVPVQPSFALLGGYPLAIAPKAVVELGAGFTFTPVPLMGMGTAKLMAAFANAGATYAVAPKIGLRAEAGVGVLLFSGVSESRFTKGAMTDGALSMVHVRVGLSADYAITPNVVATLTPIAFSYSPPKQGLDDSIDSIMSLDFMLGVGYRM